VGGVLIERFLEGTAIDDKIWASRWSTILTLNGVYVLVNVPEHHEVLDIVLLWQLAAQKELSAGASGHLVVCGMRTLPQESGQWLRVVDGCHW